MKALASIMVGLSALVASVLPTLAAQPTDWQMWHQPAAAQRMADIVWFDIYTFWFITPITIFVLLLLLYVMVRFREGANPTPSKTTHNTLVEVVWTVGPIIILIAIALPSFQLLNSQFDPGEDPAITIKATGQTWYWDYEYQDDSEISFSSNMLLEEDRTDAGKTDKAAYPRLLAVDNELVLPINETIRVVVTSDPTGVLHNFAMPAFGLKMDAVPGRLNETWFKADKEGLYYGQCSELCGINHAFMPIAIRIVSRPQYEAWKTAAADDLDAANDALMAEIARDQNIKLAGN